MDLLHEPDRPRHVARLAQGDPLDGQPGVPIAPLPVPCRADPAERNEQAEDGHGDPDRQGAHVLAAAPTDDADGESDTEHERGNAEQDRKDHPPPPHPRPHTDEGERGVERGRIVAPQPLLRGVVRFGHDADRW